MAQQSPHRRSEFSWLSRSRSRSTASLSSITCVKVSISAYCSLLRLIAGRCGLPVPAPRGLLLLAAVFWGFNSACCGLLQFFGRIAGAYCGTSRITLRSSTEAHPTPRVGLLRLVAAYILHIAASFRGMHEDFCGSLLRRLLIASCNILVIAASCCGVCLLLHATSWLLRLLVAAFAYCFLQHLGYCGSLLRHAFCLLPSAGRTTNAAPTASLRLVAACCCCCC